MATVTYDDLIKPLSSEALLADALDLFSGPGFPTMSFGAFDEPYATLQFESRALADMTVTIAAIGKMGITQDADEDALTLHAKDVWDLDRELAIPTQGAPTFTDTSGSLQSFAAGQIIFTSKTNPEITFKNVDAISVPANGTSSPFTIAADEPGALHNIQGSDLTMATPPAGITLNVGAGLSWITQTGADEESDEKLRARCLSRWSDLAIYTGPFDAYEKQALDSSSEINRVYVHEEPLAITPDPQVIVYVASFTGGASAGAVAAADALIQSKRPLGTRVLVDTASPFSVEVWGTYSVQSAYAAVARAYIDSQLAAFFGGSTVLVNGRTIRGVQIGGGIAVSFLVELIMSAQGVVDVTLTDSGGTPLATGASFSPITPQGVATLVTSSAMLVANLI